MINTFTKYIQWPDLNENSFVIGVLSYPPLAAELRSTCLNRKAGGKNIVIKELNSIEELNSCQIAFIPAFKSKALPEIVRISKDAPVLIITNKPGLALQGSGINFILKEGKIQFEVSPSNIESHGLKVSGTLRSLGILID